jgi:hypothetical protein
MTFSCKEALIFSSIGQDYFVQGPGISDVAGVRAQAAITGRRGEPATRSDNAQSSTEPGMVDNLRFIVFFVLWVVLAILA